MPIPSAPAEGSTALRHPVRAGGSLSGPLVRVAITTSILALGILAVLREPSRAASTPKPALVRATRDDHDLPSPAFVRNGCLASGAGPSMLATGDLDLDGDPDLLVASAIGGAAIHVLENRDRGTFVAHPPLPLSGITDPGTFAIADLDHDGRPDLMIPGESSANVAYLRNAGGGRFEAPILRPLSRATPVQAIAVNLDHDGEREPDVDIAIAHLTASDQLTLISSGAAPFSTGPALSVPAVLGIESLAGADLDLDGDLDLACASHETDGILILRNAGDGHFAPQGTWAAGDRPRALVAVDLNGDRRPDLIAVNRGANTVSVLLQVSTGGTELTFSRAMAYRAGDGPAIPAVADLDGDQDLDLAVPGRFSDDVTLLSNRGDGTFVESAVWTTDPGPTAAAAADWDGDGALDLAVTSAIADCVTLFRNPRPSAADNGDRADNGNRADRGDRAGVHGAEVALSAAEIRYQLSAPGHVQLVVFSPSGKAVRTLIDRDLPAGAHQVAWDGTGDRGETLPRGTYFYRLATERAVDLRRMTLD
jgi:FG-GAP-like repeat/FlgD Ig-like domain